ncbi:MAG: anhydro-N-acetylmuramic acid kinase [Chitinophagaceae bacterium]
MVYKAIGLMSGSSLDGLDIVYAHFQETAGKWGFEIINAGCYTYPAEWKEQLQNAISLSALNYQLLHTAYGHYLGEQVNHFIEIFELHHKVDLIASHGHTTFHVPSSKMTAQLGDGAAIAAVTCLPVVSDLRAMDIALGGQGAPIVPIGEKLLLSDYNLLLNLGGIANLSAKIEEDYIAFDICAANRILNMLVATEGKEYDENGNMAASGESDKGLLKALNDFEYYGKGYPKSLANDFGTDIVFPLIQRYKLSTRDALRTYVEHIAIQVTKSVSAILKEDVFATSQSHRLLVTGGGAFNSFLVSRMQQRLYDLNIEVIVPEKNIINFKEALIMALIGVLRWREEYNVLASVTGATRNSIGGALWQGAD